MRKKNEEDRDSEPLETERNVIDHTGIPALRVDVDLPFGEVRRRSRVAFGLTARLREIDRVDGRSTVASRPDRMVAVAACAMGDILLPELRSHPVEAFVVGLHFFRLLPVPLHNAKVAVAFDAHADDVRCVNGGRWIGRPFYSVFRMAISADGGIEISFGTVGTVNALPVLRERLPVATAAHLIGDVEPVSSGSDVQMAQDIVRPMARGAVGGFRITFLTLLAMNAVTIEHVLHRRSLVEAPPLVVAGDAVYPFEPLAVGKIEGIDMTVDARQPAVG